MGDFSLVDSNIFQYVHKTGRVLVMRAVDGPDQVRVIGHGRYEEPGTEESGYLWNCQELFYVGRGKQAGFRVRPNVEQQQAERQASLLGPLKFKAGGDGLGSDALHHDDIRTVAEDLRDLFPAPFETGRPIEVEGSHASTVE